MCKTCKVEFCHCFKKEPRKHAELIKAWADGATIQFWNHGSKSWMDVAYDIPSWSDEDQYRIKPEPKPDIEIVQRQLFSAENKAVFQTNKSTQKVRWTIDVETGRIKSVELLDK